jgi:hypothetical protein
MDYDGEDVTLVPIEWLKPHEEIKEKNCQSLLKMTKKWGGYTKPLIVDKATGAILDGHHRYNVGLRLDLRLLPALCIDYLTDSRISVETWQASTFEEITKEQVIEMSLSGHVFPAKTSKHTLVFDIPPIFVPLEQLQG